MKSHKWTIVSLKDTRTLICKNCKITTSTKILDDGKIKYTLKDKNKRILQMVVLQVNEFFKFSHSQFKICQ